MRVIEKASVILTREIEAGRLRRATHIDATVAREAALQEGRADVAERLGRLTSIDEARTCLALLG